MVQFLIALLVLGILIFFHELGHFLMARRMGVRVTHFSIGMPPKIVGKQVGETEFLFSAIPFGGYVRLDGQNPEDENPDDPKNYAAKKPWQKSAILAAGSLMNLLLAFVIMPLVFILGVDMPAWRMDAPVVAKVEVGSAAEKAGFLPGDRIVRIQNETTQTWNEVFDHLAVREQGNIDFNVLRGDAVQTLTVLPHMLPQGQSFGWKPLVQPVVGEMEPGSAARQAGLQLGDKVLSVNGRAITRWEELAEAVVKEGQNPLKLQIERKGSLVDVMLTPKKVGDRYMIGVRPPSKKQTYGFGEAVVKGTLDLMTMTGKTFEFLGRLVTGRASFNEVSGPVGIFSTIGEAAQSGFANLLFLAALITLQLGILNLLPIPPLDGGHLLILLIERVKGSTLAVSTRMRIQMAGSVLLFGLLFVVTVREIAQKFF